MVVKSTSSEINISILLHFNCVIPPSRCLNTTSLYVHLENENDSIHFKDFLWRNKENNVSKALRTIVLLLLLLSSASGYEHELEVNWGSFARLSENYNF